MLRRPLPLLAALLVLAAPLAAQSRAPSPLEQARVDSLRVELVRSRAFIRAAETQASKTLDLLDRLLGGSNLPGVPILPPPAEPVPPLEPAEPVPPAEPEPPTPPREVAYVVVRPGAAKLEIGEARQLCAYVRLKDGSTAMAEGQRDIAACVDGYHAWVAEGAPRDRESQS